MIFLNETRSVNAELSQKKLQFHKNVSGMNDDVETVVSNSVTESEVNSGLPDLSKYLRSNENKQVSSKLTTKSFHSSHQSKPLNYLKSENTALWEYIKRSFGPLCDRANDK